MSETMSHVERVLWRIAELGARCSQHTAAGGRGPLWAELEQTIATLDAEIESARQATDIAPAQVRSLEGRLKVALQERDREKAKVQEHQADAEAARRERDRERLKARKAMAAAVQAKDAYAAAKAAAAESMARAAAAEAANDQAMAARDEAVSALDEAIATGERAADARDTAVADRKKTVRELEAALARIAELETELETVKAAQAGREDAVDTLAARAEGAVVVLPGVALPEAQGGPVAPASRVSWKPTWSEWADPEGAAATTAPAPTPPAAAIPEVNIDVDLDAEEAAEIVLEDSVDGEMGEVRYLNVAATIAQLLPEDLGPLLLAGATVVRREGRLFATVAVPMNPWAAPGTAGSNQAERFAEAGFKVEWTAKAPMSV
jgi:hypothetical protein